ALKMRVNAAPEMPTFTVAPEHPRRVPVSNASAAGGPSINTVAHVIPVTHGAHTITDPFSDPVPDPGPIVIADNHTELASSIGCPTCTESSVSLTPSPRPLPVSNMQLGAVIHRVTPIYPTIARNNRIYGEVVLHAIINRNGAIESLEAIKGHPWLATAAI